MEDKKLKLEISDREFEAMLPDHIRTLALRHFTLFEVSTQVAKWLNAYTKKLCVLDVGCGVGKFCFALASLTPHLITGVDFRDDYIGIAVGIKKKFKLNNLTYKCQNILDLDLSQFNAFYLFNPFLEQIDATASMDKRYETSPQQYSIYEYWLRQQLENMPKGTLVVSYYITPQQIPFNYATINSDFDGTLKLWVKTQ